jgi:hypothetical protein
MVAKNARKKKSINLLSTVGADSKLTPAMPAPNFGQQSLADGDGDRLTTLAGGFCESGQ